jgi:RND family efflux transporter MFP subunit
MKTKLIRRLAISQGLALLALALSAPADEAITCEGVTEPVFDVTLSLPVPGIIAVQNLKEGEFVNTNDVILELDSRLERLEVERYRLVMENKKADWEGTLKVFDKTTSVSRDELLKKEADYRVSVAEYEIAVEEFNRRKLTAPGAGVIAEINLHVGEACSAYQPVARVVDIRQCYFICHVEAKTAVLLRTGQDVNLEIENMGTPINVKGRIVFVSPVVDAASGLQKVRAVFDNADGKIRPGLSGRMILE